MTDSKSEVTFEDYTATELDNINYGSLVEWYRQSETEVVKKTLSQHHSVHQRPQHQLSDTQAGPQRLQPEDQPPERRHDPERVVT
jgi:hypothetical protein